MIACCIFITTMLITSNQADSLLDAPGYRPPGEGDADSVFRDKFGDTSITVFPTVVRTHDGTTYDVSSAKTIVRVLGGDRASGVEVGDQQVALDKTEPEQPTQWGVFQNGLALFKEHLTAEPVQTEYAVLVEFLITRTRSGGEAIGGIECYIVDAEGENVSSFLLNSHHRLFVEGQLSTEAASAENRAALIERGMEVVAEALCQQLGLTSALDEVVTRLPSEDYLLVWSDEFTGGTLDMSKWDYRGLGPRRDAVNVREMVSFDSEGHLVLTTARVGDTYHTAMIGTQGKFEPRFGYLECRVKFQTQLGHWSAFWLQSPTVGQVGDPRVNGTEIDIFEYLVKTGDRLHHNLHWDGYGRDHKHAGKLSEHTNLRDGYHVIGLEWTPEKYVFFVDGKEVWRTDQAVSHVPEYLILSLEVGPWAGDIAEATLPDSLYVDYVRVYQKPEYQTD